MLRIIFLALLVGLVTFAHAQTPNSKINDKADSILSQRGELYFTFILPKSISIKTISHLISIDKISEKKVYAYGNRKEITKFLNLGIDFTIEQQTPANIRLKAISKNYTSWNQYPTYTQYDSMMKHYPIAFPSLCRLVEIGKSISGRSLYFMRLGKNPLYHMKKPEVMFSGCMHGDELISYILPLRLIDYLLNNYNTPEIKALMDTAEIWICPLANPDGTYFGGNNNVTNSIRYNANYIDLNRNFPDPQAGDHPDDNDWQPENIAVMNFLKLHNFSLSANFHSGSELVNYPWDTWQKTHADDNWFQTISHQYADTAHKYGPANFFTAFNNGITNGYNWYSIQGGRQDFVTYFKHGREVTVEMDSVKIVPENKLDQYWQYHYRSMINYLSAVNYGIRGEITDKYTGKALKAEVFVNNHDFDQSQIFSDSLSGMYFRMIYEGTYSLTFSANGYKSLTIDNISVSSKSQTIQDIQLEPLKENITYNKYFSDVKIYPNPVFSTINIHLDSPNYNNISIVIVDISGKVIYSEKIRNNASEINIPFNDFSPGLYFLKINSQYQNVVFKFIKQ